MTYTHVDKPIKIGNLEIKNRIFRPAHGTGIGFGIMNDALIAYHEERARGGAGLIINEIGSVHPSTRLYMNIYEPGIEPGMRKLVDRIKPHGARLFQQLWHGGHNAWTESAPWSASDIPNISTAVVPIPMTKAMIDEIVGAYADCASRMEQCGFDGVDVHCAHGYLPHQFFSALTNRREDEYGGQIENRMRFIREVLQAIRNAVSPNFVVGVRVGTDLSPGGVTIDHVLQLVHALEERKLIDYVNVSVGSYVRNDKMIAGMNDPVGYQMPTSIPITTAVKLPTLVTGRYRTLEEIDQVVRAGEADMVGLVRAMIADPYLVSKSLAGQVDRVRPCIACNQSCVGNQVAMLPIECAVNAGAGHELEQGDHMLQPVTQPRTVLVVGGGPAGLEAARVAAIRGHKVILADANPYLGGSMRAAAKLPTRHQLVDIVTWLEEEVFRLGVEVRLSTYLDADDVIEIGADAVIIATGAIERMDGIQVSHIGEPIKNVDCKGVISSTELVMATPANLGTHAVVIDDVGQWEGLGAAEFLINKGLDVTYVTPTREVGILARATLMVEPYLQRMKDKPFHYMIRTRGIAIEDGAVIVGPAYLANTLADCTSLRADTVVLVSHNRPNRGLSEELAGRVSELHLVGDAESPRFLQTAIRQGYLAGVQV